MNEILTHLITRAHDRADQWTPIFVRKFPDVEKMDELVMFGSHSYALVNTRRRLIKESITMDPATLTRETPSAIARDYLRHIYKRGPRATRGQMDRTDGIPPVPSYAKPCYFLHGFYIDIVSAYWSIMRIIGWNVDYNPGFWMSPGRPPLDFPYPDHKVARNCLVSAGRLSGIPIYNPKLLPDDPYKIVVRGSELKNNLLPRLIHDVLNSIAIQAVKAGAVYVNNDGFIAPSPNIARRVEGIIADWGLTSSIKAEGPGEVKAAGTYQIGAKRTMTFENVQNPLPIDHIYPPYYWRWLQKDFSFFASEAE